MTRPEDYALYLETGEEITLARFCMRWSGDSGMNIPPIFLAPDARCKLWQEEFYGDIWVRISRPGPGEPGCGAAEEST